MQTPHLYSVCTDIHPLRPPYVLASVELRSGPSTTLNLENLRGQVSIYVVLSGLELVLWGGWRGDSTNWQPEDNLYVSSNKNVCKLDR